MKTILSVIISLAISLIFAISAYTMPDGIGLFWSVVVCILTFLISFVFLEMIKHVRRIEKSDINNEYRFFKECGISEYHKNFSEIDFASCISSANHICLVLLYSNRFITNYINELREFVARDGSCIEFILLSKNSNSNSFKSVAEKFSYGEDKLEEKIDDFTKALRTELLPYKSTKSTIKLYFTELIPMYTLYMFDDYAYITLYKTAPERTNLIPCFKVEKSYDSSFFDFMLNDLTGIKNYAKTIEFKLHG